MMMFKMKNKGENGIAATAIERDDGEHRGVRTHLIFTGKRDADGEASGGGIGSSAGSHSALQYLGTSRALHPMSTHSNHPFGQAQQPRGAHEVMRKISRSEEQSKAANKQVSFGATGLNNWSANGVKSLVNGNEFRPAMLEVVSGLARDCFIIPLACVDRFLPAGVSLPELKSKSESNTKGEPPLNVLEVADPQQAVVVHLMTPLISVTPPSQSLPVQPERIQRNLASQLLQKTATEAQASNGLLLASMEPCSDFPMVTLYTVPKLRTDPSDFLELARKNALETFNPNTTGFCGENFFHLCQEVATIARPSSDSSIKKGKSSSTGYVVSIFRVFDGDDREKLERNWLYWTGARTLYRYLPKAVGLRRITLHKSNAVSGDKLYLLLCECANFLENVNVAAQLLPTLRARLCGYTGIYRVASAF